MKKATIAILGATSHIAKGLINNFSQNKDISLYLYARSAERVYNFIQTSKILFDDKNCVIYEGYEKFKENAYDVVINCIGTGTLKSRGDYSDYFTITEKYDNLIIEYLRNCCPDALYISFSSGAVYGREFKVPMEENTMNSIRVNHILPENYYAIARLNAEAKHRSFKNLKIVDLRIFSYFSRFIDLTDGYFITEIINSILKKEVFVVDDSNFIRDYIHPKDLYSIIKKCMNAGKINEAFDVTSLSPVSKKEILDYFSLEYGLKYKIGRLQGHLSPTGFKNIYYSNYKNAARIGYKPVFSSMDVIKEESKYILLNSN